MHQYVSLKVCPEQLTDSISEPVICTDLFMLTVWKSMAFLQLTFVGLPTAMLHRKINRMWCLVPQKSSVLERGLYILIGAAMYQTQSL